ncbi:MAG: hypothetical protein V1750_02705 [Acidobacteriota bacterium]
MHAAMANESDERATPQRTTTGFVDRGPGTGDRKRHGGPPSAGPGPHGTAAVAVALAVAYLAAATLAPALLPAVTIASVVATCALVLVRRDSRRLRVALAAIAIWLTVGFAGAWALPSGGAAGLLWVLLFLFLLPLPLISWLYWLSFPPSPGGSANESALRAPGTVPAPSHRAPEPGAPPISNHEPRTTPNRWAGAP